MQIFGPVDGILYEGASLVCWVKTIPKPVYTWTNKRTGEVTNGYQIYIYEPGTHTYICKASINLETFVKSATKETTFTIRSKIWRLVWFVNRWDQMQDLWKSRKHSDAERYWNHSHSVTECRLIDQISILFININMVNIIHRQLSL